MPGPSTGCLVLQAVGFALPELSPTPRCALTAPFHHCLPRLLGTSAVYFLWHYPVPINRKVAVSHHRALSCSDFPPAPKGQRLSDPLFQFSIYYFLFIILFGAAEDIIPKKSYSVRLISECFFRCSSSVSGKSLRKWTPRLSLRARADCVISRQTVSIF